MFFAGAVINFVFFGLLFALSIYFQTAKSFDALQTGLAFVPLTAVLTVSSLVSTIIAPRAPSSVLIAAGFTTEIAGLIILTQVLGHSSMLEINLALALIGVGSAFATPSVMGTLMSAVDMTDAGIASGLMSSARQVGGVIGVSVFGFFLVHADKAAMEHAISLGIICSILLLVISIGLTPLCGRKKPQEAPFTTD